ncbi:MAG: YceI family protein [Flavobacteriales bacterium]|nr:YceI family protein [Flavobacteriales bacterium]
MKILIISILSIFALQSLHAQKYFTKEGNISFYSDAPMEKIEATNSKATSVIDSETGAMQWSVLIKAFHFEKSLMEEHFNENYMESSKFPKAFFKGKIDNIDAVDFEKDGVYTTDISGSLEIHGVEQDVTTQGTITVKGGGIKGDCTFTVAVADYDIEIPALVADNIAKEVEIHVQADYQKLNK